MMQTNIFDICERKHGGNKQSRAAFDRLAPKLAESQQAVLSVIRNAGLRGATNKEIAQLLGWACTASADGALSCWQRAR